MLRPVTVRKLPKVWDPVTCEKFHSSVEQQHHLPEEIQEVFGNMSLRKELVEPLLPFEVEMKENWELFVNQTECKLVDGLEVSSYDGISWKEVGSVLLDVISTFFSLKIKERWSSNTSNQSSEHMAQEVLESEGPSYDTPLA